MIEVRVVIWIGFRVLGKDYGFVKVKVTGVGLHLKDNSGILNIESPFVDVPSIVVK